MRIINNTCVEVLPTLLNKTKVSTIRKAFDIVEFDFKDKPAKYEIGDVCEMAWNEFNPHEWFCRYCGKESSPSSLDENICSPTGHGYNGFNKNIGKVEIIEVYKITIEKDDVDLFPFGFSILKHNSESERELMNEEELAEKDGFESAQAMFKYLDDTYDLIIPKEFWVYEYRWL